MKLFICKHCDKPLACEVENGNLRFCVNCSSNGACLVEKACLCGRMECEIVDSLAHYICRRMVQ